MKYARKENIKAIQWDGTSEGAISMKEEMPEIVIPWVHSKEKYLKPMMEIVFNDGESEHGEDYSTTLKGGEYLVRIEDYLGTVEYRIYSKECFEEAFTKE